MDSFDLRKKNILGKADKSYKGEWDERVVELCNELNKLRDYYTTSSCSGKSIIMVEKTGKDGSYYLWQSHEKISLEELENILFSLKSKSDRMVKFKYEPPAFFVACRDMGSAKRLFLLAKESGFKKTGIVITNKLFGVEILSNEKLEFPVIFRGRVLVGRDFLKEVVKKVNVNLGLGWDKINILWNKILNFSNL